MVYLICYDIVCDRRRTRVARVLESYGLRVQKSVFEAVLQPHEYQKLHQKLQSLLVREATPQEYLECDQLRFYPISEHSRTRMSILGVQPNFAIDDEVLIV
ncbi:CRISPR-associated endonuclease Cas2 [Roseofilum sp. BLCC_M154]|uniref:CRISPR-associated endoribonuclease Cas2 n=1 Tax=Roseofilum acuticapitatum BLCC-M154 TaxID=3022444 RepID=A0ABT7AQ79_9CYAN|nr:CRISPR-associated endonuclease Cas2 [Roseofilum acuticapitatum]MDJ1168742.1 CRISPR-associated endonuclease Cas2 [Roseofilum acuticapitatum BLCC-M154]